MATNLEGLLRKKCLGMFFVAYIVACCALYTSLNKYAV